MAEFGPELRFVSLITLLLFALSISLGIIGGLNPTGSLLWNSVSALHLDYDIISFGMAQNPFILAAEIIDALVFTLLAYILATISYEFIKKVKIEERIDYFKIRRMKDHIILAPLNRFSESLAERLQKEQIKCVILRPERYDQEHIRPKHILTIRGDLKSVEAFEALGIARAKALVACSEDDIENAMIILTAKSVNRNIKVMSRASGIESIPRLSRAGAARIIMPEVTAGTRMGEEILKEITVKNT
jgi:voltage-gated potassium channel